MCNGLVKVILLRQFHFCFVFVFVLFVGMFLSLSCSNPPIIDWPWLALVLVLSVLLLLLLFVFACCLLWSFDMFWVSCSLFCYVFLNSFSFPGVTKCWTFCGLFRLWVCFCSLQLHFTEFCFIVPWFSRESSVWYKIYLKESKKWKRKRGRKKKEKKKKKKRHQKVLGTEIFADTLACWKKSL